MSKTDIDYAMQQLRQDKYFDKISVQQHKPLIQSALQLGEKVAAQYQGLDIKQHLQQQGYQIQYVKNPAYVLKQGLMTRAEILEDKQGKRILIYIDSIDNAIASLSEKQIHAEFSDIEHLYLAHEFFHSLEDAKQVQDPVLNTQVIRMRLFGKAFYGRLQAPSEIASNRFAHCFCQSSFNPLLLDELFIGQSNDT